MDAVEVRRDGLRGRRDGERAGQGGEQCALADEPELERHGDLLGSVGVHVVQPWPRR
jgi:hypothetical protein